ncbi:uncharacterized protein F4817DRAFT_347512 [Daldinia loculata]|uniref:uncharacterized protein n=1 Tax=Daldinia loculata TaxID=103429 RepID=UPI0020C4D103|nr:uncharacterized protein F4817DRAFT_347512 [Daldinia loculata]KAI1644186.1 hypothetical protein F4817DRAFT_347512 [Daldinia loculata]
MLAIGGVAILIATVMSPLAQRYCTAFPAYLKCNLALILNPIEPQSQTSTGSKARVRIELKASYKEVRLADS